MSSELYDATPAPPGEVKTVVISLVLALTLAALDQNIVGVALPRIVSDLGGLSHLSWVVTAFLVTSTATTPLYGKLSDVFGRKQVYLVAMSLFLVGSVLCGSADFIRRARRNDQHEQCHDRADQVDQRLDRIR